MWEPRVIYQQSYIYTTVNIIRSREPFRYKTFPQTIPFSSISFHPQLLSSKINCSPKSSKQTHCKTEMASSDQWTEHPHFFLGNGETSRSAAVPSPISGKQLPTSPWLPSSQWPLCTPLDLSSMSLQDATGHQLNLMRLAPLRTKIWSEVPSRDRWSLSPSHGNFCCPIGLQKGRSSSLIV